MKGVQKLLHSPIVPPHASNNHVGQVGPNRPSRLFRERLKSSISTPMMRTTRRPFLQTSPPVTRSRPVPPTLLHNPRSRRVPLNLFRSPRSRECSTLSSGRNLLLVRLETPPPHRPNRRMKPQIQRGRLMVAPPHPCQRMTRMIFLSFNAGQMRREPLRRSRRRRRHRRWLGVLHRPRSR